MALLGYKIIAALLIFLTSIAAIIYPIKVRARPQHRPLLELADAFASGIFLGAALFHMLPEAVNQFQGTLPALHYPLAELFCASGFLILLFLERLSQHKAHLATHSMPYVLTLILIIHAFIEGAALGINTAFATVSVIFLAVIAHKGSESFALAVILNRSTLTTRRVIMIVGLFSLMTPLGIALGSTLTTFLQYQQGQLLTAGFNAFAAGTFLYMSTLHHINHHERQHDAEGLLEFLCLLVGISLMAMLAF